MKFGEVLKGVRTQHKDSLRRLAEKTGIYFTYIDKIEKSEKPINVEILGKLLKEYPLQKKELIESYVKETIPDFVVEEIKSPVKNNSTKIDIKNSNIKELCDVLLEELEINEQKDILETMIERMEVLSFRKGTLEKEKIKFDKVRKRITEL